MAEMLMYTAGSYLLNSLLAPKTPEPEAPVAMPVQDDAKKAEAKRRATSAAQQRGGRTSTVLSKKEPSVVGSVLGG